MNKHRTIGIDLAKSSFYLVTLSPQASVKEEPNSLEPNF